MSASHAPTGLDPRLAWSTLASGAHLVRHSGLAGSLSPLTLARFARDLVRWGRRGAASVLHLHTLADPRRPALVVVPDASTARPDAAGTASAATAERRLSYGELEARIFRAAHALHRLGIGPRDRVALFLKNGREHIELNSACSYLGAVSVPISHRLKGAEVAYILRHSGARLLVLHDDLTATAEAALAELGDPQTFGRDRCLVTQGTHTQLNLPPGFRSYEALLEDGDPHAPPAGGGDSHGVMIYTSGTTGKPKGARRDYKESHLETLIHFVAALPLRRDERHLVVCPMYHSAPALFSIINYIVGGCLVILEHFDPRLVLRTIERERITSAFLVPTLYQRLVDLDPEELGRHDLTSLRWLMSGAAPLPTELAKRIEQRFGQLLYNFYGATETGIVTLARPGEHTARPGTIGRLVPGNELRLLDEAGRDVPDGEVGEIYVRSRFLMQGYHDDEAATRAAAREGFLSVGDLAWRDADGYYYLADRKIDMVISGGVNIYPYEIEQRLHEHPAVADAAVVGAPDPDWGESLVAFVVLRPGTSATAEELAAHVTARLADYKRPRRVLFVDELPRTPTGKVLKRELRARLATEDGARRLGEEGAQAAGPGASAS